MQKKTSTDLKLESKSLDGKQTLFTTTVRNLHYCGFEGKLACIITWLIRYRNVSFRQFLAMPVSYTNLGYDDLISYYEIRELRNLKKYLEEKIKNELR